MTNQANQSKHEQERWEAFLDTVFAKSKDIQEIRMDIVSGQLLKVYMDGAGYDGLCMGLTDNPPHLWDAPIKWDETTNSPRIVYLSDPQPKPKPKPKREKPVDTWIDDEV